MRFQQKYHLFLYYGHLLKPQINIIQREYSFVTKFNVSIYKGVDLQSEGNLSFGIPNLGDNFLGFAKLLVSQLDIFINEQWLIYEVCIELPVLHSY